MGVDNLLQHLDEVPAAVVGAVRNAGGGFVNHDHFFHGMSPDGGGEPGGRLGDELKTAFGSFARFQQMFTLAALEVFGSGWAWLIWDSHDSKLKVTSTPNQDTPAMTTGIVPLLGLDVWEHAYYLKHQSRRKSYVDSFWNVVNWPEIMTRFDAAEKTNKESKAEL